MLAHLFDIFGAPTGQPQSNFANSLLEGAIPGSVDQAQKQAGHSSTYLSCSIKLFHDQIGCCCQGTVLVVEPDLRLDFWPRYAFLGG